MFCRNHRKNIGLVLLASALLYAVPARADITELRPLDFGEWVVTDPGSVQTITVPAVGAYSHSAGLIEISPPQSGRYEVSGLPSNGVVLSIDVAMVDPLAGAGGSNFTMDNFTTSYVGPDVSGVMILHLGARAVSQAGGTYPDQIYNGMLEATFNF